MPGLAVEQRLSSHSRAGHWSLQVPFEFSLLQGQGSGAASTAAPNEAHKLLGARLGVCQLGQVSPGRDVTWERCHLAEMSLGRVVTLLPCGQLGTISGDAVPTFVISCPAHYI